MVNNRTSLDPRWSNHMATPAVGFMTADIRVTRKDPSVVRTYNQLTRTWSNNGISIIFEGKARVQPYGIIGDELLAQDPTGKRLMRVQIADKVTGINLDDRLEVVTCENNPELETFEMSVRGTIGSNVAWLTDLVCEANLKRNIISHVIPDILFPGTNTYPAPTLFPRGILSFS